MVDLNFLQLLINNFVVQVERDKERKKTDKPKKEDKY